MASDSPTAPLSDGGELDIEGLQFEWRLLAEAYSKNDRSIELAFQLLRHLYSLPGLVYHNLTHIRALLTLAREIADTLVSYDTVRFAIWFHDAIYDTHRSDNEERSAELSDSLLESLDVPGSMVSAVNEMIIATKLHAFSDGSPDVDAFLDLDLSILGAPAEIYQQYAREIREEYSWVPDPVYNEARASILNRFLEEEPIYNTEWAQDRFEERARINIGEELAQLARGTS